MRNYLKLLMFMFGCVFATGCDQAPQHDTPDAPDCGTSAHVDAELPAPDAQVITADAQVRAPDATTTAPDADLTCDWAPAVGWGRVCGCGCGTLCAPDVPVIGDLAVCMPRCLVGAPGPYAPGCAADEYCDAEFGGPDGVCRPVTP